MTGLINKLRRRARFAIGALGTAAISMAAYAFTALGPVDADAAVATLPGAVAYPTLTVFGAEELKIVVVVEKPAVDASATGGQDLFNTQCIACHGVDAGGVEGLGVSLVDSSLIVSSSQEELIEFLKIGRMPTDPATISGLVMPGFPWIAEADLAALAVYLQSIAE